MRVLIVDDNSDVRTLVRQVLEAKRSFEVVGEAADGAEAIAKVESLRPRLVIMDVRMPGMDGIEATKKIKERWPDTVVVAFSAFNQGSEEMLAAGASAYVLKDFLTQEVILRVAATMPSD